MGKKLSLENLAQLWPEVARHWRTFGEALVLREFKGPPLRSTARLFTVVPLAPPVSHRGAFALAAEVGGQIDLLTFTRGGLWAEPPTAADEAYYAGCSVCDPEAKAAIDLINARLIDPGVQQCALPAEHTARFYAFLGSHFIPVFKTPYGMLVSPAELASVRDDWFPEQARAELERFVLEPRYLPYEFLPAGTCVVDFRTADGLGLLYDWRVGVPVRDWDRMARLILSNRFHLWAARPGPSFEGDVIRLK